MHGVGDDRTQAVAIGFAQGRASKNGNPILLNRIGSGQTKAFQPRPAVFVRQWLAAPHLRDGVLGMEIIAFQECAVEPSRHQRAEGRLAAAAHSHDDKGGARDDMMSRRKWQRGVLAGFRIL